LVHAFESSKGIVLVGPKCSGKSALLRVASTVMFKFAKVLLKTSIVSPETYSLKELFGNTETPGIDPNEGKKNSSTSRNTST
jgi:predicted ATP-binding protein involved in virulence